MEKWPIQRLHYNSFLPVFRLPIVDYLVVSNQFITEKDKIVPDANRVIYFAKKLEVRK